MKISEKIDLLKELGAIMKSDNYYLLIEDEGRILIEKKYTQLIKSLK